MAEELSKETVDALDKLFNAWLAENYMISKGGVIYEGTKDGRIKQDEKGEKVRANPETLRNKISNKDAGFAHYVQKHNKSIHITVQEQPFPEAE